MQFEISTAEAELLLDILKEHSAARDLRERLRLSHPSLAATPTPAPRWVLGARSRERLKGVHPDLVRVVHRALTLSPVDFTVLEGLRSIERQRMLVAKGASKTLNSRHLTGHAVDIAPLIDGKVSWDWQYYYPLATAMKEAAQLCNVRVEWGGDWATFRDGPHWQLPR